MFRVRNSVSAVVPDTVSITNTSVYYDTSDVRKPEKFATHIPTAIKDDCGKSRFVVCGNLYQKSAVASSKLIGAVMSPVFCLLKKDTTW